MSLFKQLSASINPRNPFWILFSNTNLVSSFHIFSDLCNNIYTHLFITVLGIIGYVNGILFHASYRYTFIVHVITLFMPFFGIANVYTYLCHRKQYEKQLRRAVTIVEDVSGASHCNITPLLVVCCVLMLMSLSMSCVLIKAQDLYVTFYQVVWAIWAVYQIGHITCFSVAIAVPRYGLQQMRYILSGSTDHVVSCDQVIRFLGYYDELIEICKKIDGHYGIRNTANIVFTLIALVNQTFLMICRYLELLIKLNGLHSLSVWIASVFGGVWFVVVVAFIIYSCSSVECEVEKFNQVLSSLVIRDNSGSLVSNPYVTAHFAIGKELKFSGCGCFYIDYRLGYSMLAAYITYLVYMVEFEDMNGSTSTDFFKAAPTSSN